MVGCLHVSVTLSSKAFFTQRLLVKFQIASERSSLEAQVDLPNSIVEIRKERKKRVVGNSQESC
jgi:hypothetical protein